MHIACYRTCHVGIWYSVVDPIRQELANNPRGPSPSLNYFARNPFGDSKSMLAGELGPTLPQNTILACTVATGFTCCCMNVGQCLQATCQNVDSNQLSCCSASFNMYLRCRQMSDQSKMYYISDQSCNLISFFHLYPFLFCRPLIYLFLFFWFLFGKGFTFLIPINDWFDQEKRAK